MHFPVEAKIYRPRYNTELEALELAKHITTYLMTVYRNIVIVTTMG